MAAEVMVLLYVLRPGEEFARVVTKKRGHFADGLFPRKRTYTALYLGNKGGTYPYRLGKPAQSYPALLAPRADVLPESHGLTIAEFAPMAARDLFLAGMKEKYRKRCSGQCSHNLV